MIYLELEETNILAIERANLISSELLSISRPYDNPTNTANQLFSTLDYGDNAYLLASLDYSIAIYPNKDTARLFFLIGNVTNAESEELADTLSTFTTIKFSDLLTSTAVIRDEEWMFANDLLVQI